MHCICLYFLQYLFIYSITEGHFPPQLKKEETSLLAVKSLESALLPQPGPSPCFLL